MRHAWSVLACALAVLELLHPTWNGEAVSEAVRAAGQGWVALHVLLLLGYAALTARLYCLVETACARAVLLAFAASQSAYLAVDGLAVGTLAQSDPAAADTLWASAWVTVLADVTGATWAASLLLLAVSIEPASTRAVRLGACVTW